MSKQNVIRVISGECSNKQKIRGSTFIGRAYKVTNSKEAEDILSRIRKEYYDASHHCFAYKINDGSEKYSDDGEPNGTAGIRIMNAIESASLTNLLVIVIRYFGGTKLGVGPLGKAYSETALELLSAAEKIELKRFQKIRIEYSYNDTSAIHFLLNKYICREIESGYDDGPIINAKISPDSIDLFREELIERTSGNAQLHKLEEEVYLRLN
jgi:uncharacterized YigZ family protein